jgi:hypothetical protein
MGVDMQKRGAFEMRFNVYRKRQFMDESININGLACHLIWSTFKTLPATLPERSSKFCGPRLSGLFHAISFVFYWVFSWPSKPCKRVIW